VFGAAGEPLPTAFHLPLLPALLAVFSELGLTSYTAHQVVGWALGAGTVALVGIAARQLWDERAGLAAAAIAAVYPPLVANDSIGQVESLYGFTIAAVIVLALWLRERPSTWRAVALGGALAAAALTRGEAPALAALLLPWVAWRGGGIRNAAVAAAVLIVVCVPWAIRNTATFDEPVGLTTSAGSVVAGANAHSAYYGHLFGGWDPAALGGEQAGHAQELNEAVQDDEWLDRGRDYAGDHAGRLPAVVGARVLRLWSVYPWSPARKADYAEGFQSRLRSVEYAGQAALVVVAVLAVVGAFALRRRAEPLWPLVAPIVLVTLVSALAYGDLRFRQAADVAMVALAGIGAMALAERRRSKTA
jgi:4-amino-4-deoxy-L-arabinose transferase-like glycosyltransferase